MDNQKKLLENIRILQEKSVTATRDELLSIIDNLSEGIVNLTLNRESENDGPDQGQYQEWRNDDEIDEYLENEEDEYPEDEEEDYYEEEDDYEEEESYPDEEEDYLDEEEEYPEEDYSEEEENYEQNDEEDEEEQQEGHESRFCGISSIFVVGKEHQRQSRPRRGHFGINFLTIAMCLTFIPATSGQLETVSLEKEYLVMNLIDAGIAIPMILGAMAARKLYRWFKIPARSVKSEVFPAPASLQEEQGHTEQETSEIQDSSSEQNNPSLFTCRPIATPAPVWYMPEKAIQHLGVTGKSNIFHIPVILNGTAVPAVWDARTSVSYIPEITAKHLNLEILPNFRVAYTIANGIVVQFKGTVLLSVKMGTTVVKHIFRTSEDEDCPGPVLLGTDFRRKLKANGIPVKRRKNKGILQIGKEAIPILAQPFLANNVMSERKTKEKAQPNEREKRPSTTKIRNSTAPKNPNQKGSSAEKRQKVTAEGKRAEKKEEDGKAQIARGSRDKKKGVKPYKPNPCWPNSEFFRIFQSEPVPGTRRFRQELKLTSGKKAQSRQRSVFLVPTILQYHGRPGNHVGAEGDPTRFQSAPRLVRRKVVQKSSVPQNDKRGKKVHNGKVTETSNPQVAVRRKKEETARTGAERNGHPEAPRSRQFYRQREISKRFVAQ